MSDLQSELDEHRRKVDVDYFDVTLREIIRMVVEDELKTDPEYQRKFRWKDTDESRLIESLLLGLPVPSIFVATNPDGTWEVVDGLQRVSTIVHFAGEGSTALAKAGREEPLRLSDLDKLTQLSGKTFAEVPTPVRLAFFKRMLRVTALSDKAVKEVRFDMFERLNNGGVSLTQQEVRTAVYRGPFIDLIGALSKDKHFNSLIKLQASHNDDGTKEEIVLKMFAYLYNRGSFKGDVKGFLNHFAEIEGPAVPEDEIKEVFHKTVTALSNVIVGPVLRNRVNVTPVNQLEGILVAGAELVRQGVHAFNPQPGWLNDKDLVSFSTKGTNTKSQLNGRIDRSRALLQGAPVK